MKKLVLGLAAVLSAALLVSCASKKAEPVEVEEEDDPFAMFAEEDDGLLHLEYKYVGTADGTTCTDIPAATLTTRKDYSKPEPLDIFCDDPEYVEFCGQKCVKIPSNGDGNIRVIWLFDKPIDAASVSTLSYTCGGLDIPEDNTWTANVSLVYNYDNITTGEHKLASYPVAAALDGFITKTIDLNSEEGQTGLWGNGYIPEGQFLGIQIYYGGRDPLFIKDLILK